MVAEAISRAATFILGALIARVSGLDSLAYLSLAQGLVAYVTVISDGGLNEHAVRRIVGGESSSAVVADTSRTQLVLAGLSTGAVIALTFAITPLAVPYVTSLVGVGLASAASIPYVLRADGRIFLLAIARLVGAASTVIVGLILLVSPAVQYPPIIGLAYSAGAICLSLATIWFSRTGSAPFFRPVPSARIIALGREALPLGLSGLVVQAFSSLPLILTEKFGSSSSFQAMGVSIRLWFIAVAPAAMVGTVLVPKFADTRTRPEVLPRLVALSSALGIACSAVCYFLAEPLLTVVFGAAAAAYAGTFAVFMLGAMPYYAASVLLSSAIARGAYWVVLASSSAGLVAYIAASIAWGVGDPSSWALAQAVGLAAVVLLPWLMKVRSRDRT